MKYFGLMSTWALGLVSIALLSISSTLTEADPTDDFSMSLGGHSTRVGVYRLMQEDQVSHVLRDRLDLFPKSQVPRLARHLVSLCKWYRFDPAFILSLIEEESRFRIKAISPVGALGLMQIMPATARFVIEDLGFNFSGHEIFEARNLTRESLSSSVLMEPFVNIAIGISYLAWLRDHYHGFPAYILAAYNVGPAKMDELLSRKSFRPTLTKTYFQAIRRRVPQLRFYEPVRNERKIRAFKPRI